MWRMAFGGGGGGEVVEEASKKHVKPNATTSNHAAAAITAAAAGATVVDVGAKKKKKKKKNKKAGANGAESADGIGGGQKQEQESDSDSDVEVAVLAPKGKKPASSSSTSSSSAAVPAVASVGGFVEEDAGTQKLDPMELAVREIVSRGFNRNEVEVVMNLMWDQGKDYGNPEKVIEELAVRHEMSAMDKVASPSPKPTPVPAAARTAPQQQQQQHQQQEIKKNSKPKAAAMVAPSPPAVPIPTPSPVAASAPVAIPHQQSNSKSKKNKASAAPPEKKQQQEQELQPPSAAPGPAPAAAKAASVAAVTAVAVPKGPLMSRGALLELAASKEDTSIVDKLSAVAGFLLRPDTTPEDRHALLSSRALDLLFQGVVKSCLDHPKQYPSDPALTGALSSLLRVLVGSAAPLDNFLTILTHAQTLQTQRPLTDEVVKLLSQTLGGSIKDFYAKKHGSARAWKELAALDGPLKQARSAVGGGVGGKGGGKASGTSTKEMFELRDKHAHVMELQQQACLLLAETAATAATAPSTHPLPGSVGSKTSQRETALVDAVLKGSLGVTSQAQLEQKRREIAVAKTDLSAVEASLEGELRPLLAAVGAAKETLQKARAKKDALLAELKVVEAEVGAAERTLATKEGQVSARRAGMEQSVMERNQKLQGMMADVRRADAADELALKVHSLTVALSESLTKALAAEGDKYTSQLRERLRAFAAAFEPYLEVETKCVEFLQGRVTELEGERAKALAEL
eukprot:evm.model.NODE_32970_length_10329_cov_25.798626.1